MGSEMCIRDRPMINQIKNRTATVTAQAVGNQILVIHHYRHAKTGIERATNYWLDHRHLMRLLKFKQVNAMVRYAKAFDKSERIA